MNLVSHSKKAAEVIAGIFILLFVYTALSKLMDLNTFKSVLSKSPLIGSRAAFVAWSIPISELIIAALLFLPSTRKLGLVASLGLLLLFTLYIAYMLVFTPQLPCSCGGVLQTMDWDTHLAFNIGALIIGFAGWKLEEKEHLRAKSKFAYT